MAGPIRISVLANASQAKRELNGVAGETKGLGAKFGKMGKVAGAGLAVAGVAAGAFAVSAVKAASDAQQSLGATETVFGKFAKKVIKTSDQAATKYGLSANVYRENANLIGSLFKGQGVAVDQLAGKTQKMIGTAADLSATFGGTTSEAVSALSSAFKGEFDPLERYGISIKQSDINARLAAKGQDKLTGAALKQAKQVATTELINKQAAQTHGAFAKETNTLAHQQQVLGAQWDNLKAKVGSALLPVLTKLLTLVNKNLVPAFEAVGQFMAPLIAKFKSFFDGLGEGNGKVSALADFFTNKVMPAVMGIVAAFQGLVAVVLPIITQVVDAIRSQWSVIQPEVMAIWGSVKSIILSAMSIIRSYIQIVTAVIRAIWQRFGGFILNYITGTLRNVITFIRGAFQIIQGIFKVVSSVLKGDWKGVWTGIKQIASGAMNVLKALLRQGWNVIKNGAQIAWAAIKEVISRAWDKIKTAVRNKIAEVVSLAKGIAGKVKSAVGDLGGILKDAGKQIIQGLIDGIDDMIGSLKGKLGSVTKLIPKHKGPPSKDKVLLRRSGRLIMQGLIDGLKDGEDGVKKSLGALTDRIQNYINKRYSKASARERNRYNRSVMAVLADEYAALRRNGAAQERVSKRLTDARQKLVEIVKASKDYAANVKAAVVGTGDITRLGANGAPGNSDNLLSELRQKLAAAQQFSALIAQLTKAGLNKTAIQNLIDAGVEGGLATAQALSAGGADAIAEVNSLQAQLAKVGQNLGTSTASTMHSAGIQAAQGLVRGLESQARKLDRAAVRLANALVKAVKKALGIHSPSRVFKGLGKNVTKGLTIGLDETYVKRSGEVLAASLQKGFGQPALDAYMSTATGAGSDRTITIKFTAEQLSQLQRGREIRADLDAYEGSGGRRKA